MLIFKRYLRWSATSGKVTSRAAAIHKWQLKNYLSGGLLFTDWKSAFQKTLKQFHSTCQVKARYTVFLLWKYFFLTTTLKMLNLFSSFPKMLKYIWLSKWLFSFLSVLNLFWLGLTNLFYQALFQIFGKVYS